MYAFFMLLSLRIVDATNYQITQFAIFSVVLSYRCNLTIEDMVCSNSRLFFAWFEVIKLHDFVLDFSR